MEIRLISIIKNHIYWYTPSLFKMCSVREKKKIVSSKSLGNIAHSFSPWRSTQIKDSENSVMLQKTNLILLFPTLFEQFEHVSPNFPARENLSKLFWKTCAECQFGEMISYTKKVSC